MNILERARSEYIVELEERVEQLEQDANDWRENYLIAFARAEKAEDKLVDTAERCEQLEQLCKCMYANFGNYAMSHDEHGLLSLMDIFTRRMGELRLLRIDGLCDLGQDHLHNSTAGLLEVE
ncbi:MAG: hypothetical protein IJ113_06470 [Eggerthellaceae bacterium]|nr:hypothetical protein [Eggerthellaceae bacterium]